MQASVKRFIYKTTSPSEIRGNRQGPFGRNPIETMNRWKASISYPAPLQKKYSRVLIRRTDPDKRTGQKISFKKDKRTGLLCSKNVSNKARTGTNLKPK